MAGTPCLLALRALLGSSFQQCELVALAGSALQADLVLVAVLVFASRLSRGGRLPFLARASKVSKRSAPCCPCPCAVLRCGQPAVLGPRVGPQNSLRGCAAPCKQLRPVRSRSRCVLRRICAPCALCASARVEGLRREPRACLLCVWGWKVLFSHVSRWRLLDQRWRLIWCLLLFEILLAADRAAATYFPLLRQRKVSKGKATLLPVSLSCAPGNLRCSIPGWGRRTHCAPASLRSNSCGQSDHKADASCGASAHPALCAPRHGKKGDTLKEPAEFWPLELHPSEP
jgi:hypothetical protein